MLAFLCKNLDYKSQSINHFFRLFHGRKCFFPSISSAFSSESFRLAEETANPESKGIPCVTNIVLALYQYIVFVMSNNQRNAPP